MLRHALEAQGHAVVEARDECEAIRRCARQRPAVVLTDLKLPNGDGFGVLRAAKELDPDLQVVVMTAYGSIQDAVSAMKEGAMEFLAKPGGPRSPVADGGPRAGAPARAHREHGAARGARREARRAAHHRRRSDAAQRAAAPAPGGRHRCHRAS
jgi:DNA-binding NtrC family response regulator